MTFMGSYRMKQLSIYNILGSKTVVSNIYHIFCVTKHCILAGASGIHAVCVCTIHQNVKLMMVGAKIPDIVLDSVALKTYDHCFAHIICNLQIVT